MNFKEYKNTIEGYEDLRNQIDEILLYLDFEKIHRVMEFLDWKWGSWTNEYGDKIENEVPSVHGLKTFVYDYLIKIINECDTDDYSISTGGFEFTLQDRILNIKFIIESV